MMVCDLYLVLVAVVVTSTSVCGDKQLSVFLSEDTCAQSYV